MLDLEVVSQFMTEHFQKVTTSKGGTHFLARCLLCGDSVKHPNKRRFNLDYNNGNPFYHCFNCTKSGSFLELYSTIKCISIAESKRELFAYDPNRLVQQLSPKKEAKIVKEIEFDDHAYILDDCLFKGSEPGGILEKQWHKKLMDFIEDRRIPQDVPVYIAYKGDYQGRIILPIIQDGVITYFQGRALETTDYSQKYMNPTLTKGSIIFNKDNFERDKSIIVTEGLIDAMQIGNQGTSCLGASVSDDLIKSLLELTDKDVIVAMDNDVAGLKETIRLMKNSKYSHLLKYFLLIGHKYSCRKDLGELVQKESIEDVYNFVVSNSYSKFDAEVKLKMGGIITDAANTNRKRLRGSQRGESKG